MSGPSAMAKPMSPKISATSSNTWLTGWMRPSCNGPTRTGSVTSAVSAASRAVERAALQLRLAALKGVADARLEAVDSLAEGLALIGRERAQPRHQLGDAALLAERSDAHALDGAKIARAGYLGEQGVFEGGKVGGVSH